jgi:hypothetical protein
MLAGFIFSFRQRLELALLSVLSAEFFSPVQRGAFALGTGTL